MHTARSARRTASMSRSASEYTCTVSMPRSRHERLMRTAISPRFAIRIRRIGSGMCGSLRLGCQFELEIDDDGAGLADDDRIEVERRDARIVGGERRYAGDDAGERVDVELRLAARAGEQRIELRAPQQRLRAVGIEWRQPHHRLAQDLHIDAA